MAQDDHGRPLHDYEVGSDVCYACEAKALEHRRITTDGDTSAMDGRQIYTLRSDEEARP